MSATNAPGERFIKLIERLGHRRFVAQGGDWGERRAFERLKDLFAKGVFYALEMAVSSSKAAASAKASRPFRERRTCPDRLQAHAQ